MRFDSRFSPRPGVHVRIVDDGAVILDARSGACFELNRIGAQIWSALAESKSLREISQDLGRRYPIDQDTLATDVDRLVGQFVRAGLVEELAPSG